jgi:anti-anti-sigma factor
MSETPATLIDRQPDVVVVHVQAKDLDENNIARVRADVSAAASEAPSVPFVIDLANVKFVPSLTLGILVRLNNEFKARGQRLILVSLQPTVRRVIAITRLDRLFEILDDVPAALNSIRLSPQPG